MRHRRQNPSGQNRPVRPSAVVVAAWALLVWSRGVLAVEASPPASQMPELTADREVVLWADRSLSPRDLTARFGGRQQRVVALREISPDPGDQMGPWRIVLYVDPALSLAKDIADAAAALAARAADLTSLGTVEVVVADPRAETIFEPSRDSDELRATLRELPELVEGAGEPPPAQEQEVGPVARVERELLSERRLELLRWIAQDDHAGPRCLLLLQRGFDARPAPVPETSPSSDSGDGAAGAPLAVAGDVLDATLAALGWRVFPLAPVSGATEPLPGGLAASSHLAQATGGEVITGREGLVEAVGHLRSAVLATVRLSGPPNGVPRPLEIRPLTAGVILRAPRWATIATPLALSEIRALRFLEDRDSAAGELRILGVLRPDIGATRSVAGSPALLEALTLSDSRVAPEPLFRVTVMTLRVDEHPTVAHEIFTSGDLASADAWLYRRRWTLAEDLVGGAVVIEELRSGRWGAAVLELSDRGLRAPGRRVVEWSSPTLDERPRAPVATAEEAVVIRLLPPRERPARGRTRFETLVSLPGIRRVEFFLDGTPSASDEDPPFAATLDLGPEGVTRTVKVVAYAADGSALGSHQITVNPADDSFQVRIVGISVATAGTMTVEARVRAPSGARLDRVEFYRNDALIETLEQPPFRVDIPVPVREVGDLVRVAAYLDDGTWIDDARLLDATSISERVEVNLVELHVMVTDRDGKPARDLGPADFSVRLRGVEQRIESLAQADEVPLLLGVVIDTSESMWPLMPDTKKAGAQFVANTLSEGDSAFLVDFDTRPRLAHDTTTDTMALLRTFGGLTADGFTALYDAVIFSMLQFEEAAGRKALVLLTDGDDYRSRYGPRRGIQYGRRLGVPVYIISLAGIRSPRRNLRRIDLEGLTEATGGRVFYISEMGQLAGAYASINEELRSQYVLTFSTDRQLPQEELDDLHVLVARKGLSVRAVVGGQEIR